MYSMATFAGHDGNEGRRLPALQKGPHWVTWPNPYTNLDCPPGKFEALPAVVAQWTARPIDRQRMDNLSRPKIMTPRKAETGIPRPKPTYFHAISDRDLSNRLASAPSAEPRSSPARLACEPVGAKPKSPRKLTSIDGRSLRKAPKMAWLDEENKNKDEETKAKESKGATAQETPPIRLSAQPKVGSPRKAKQPIFRGGSGKNVQADRLPLKSNLTDRGAVQPVNPTKGLNHTRKTSRFAPKLESPESPRVPCLSPKEPPVPNDTRQHTAWQESARHDIASSVPIAEIVKQDQEECNDDDDDDDDESDASGSYFERIMAREEEMELLEKQIPSLRKSHNNVRKSVEFRRASRKSFLALKPQLGPWVRQMINFVGKSQEYVSGDVGYIFDVSRASSLEKMLPAFKQTCWKMQNRVIFEQPNADQNMAQFKDVLSCWVTQMVDAVVTSFPRFSPRHCDGDGRGSNASNCGGDDDSASSLHSWFPEDIQEENLYEMMVRDPKRASVLQRELPSLRESIAKIRRSTEERRHSALWLFDMHDNLQEWVRSMTNECITNFVYSEKTEGLGIIFDTARRVEMGKMLPSFNVMAKNMRASCVAMDEQTTADLREWVRHMLTTLTYKDDRTRRNDRLGAAEVERRSTMLVACVSDLSGDEMKPGRLSYEEKQNDG
eukprot:GEMP01004519.1.p1 GENE.GEMP01004519.1~~GEMP01004519.1.p1  ORF type:complete len:666 (+),score=134.34 GEMP01004519.1:70-2067(+)